MLPWLEARIAERVGAATLGPAGRPAPVRLHGPRDPGDGSSRARPSPMSTPRGRRSAGRAATPRSPAWPIGRSAGSWTTPAPSRSASRVAIAAYAGIVLDPPSYGHGADGRAWRIETDLEPLAGRMRPRPRAGRVRPPDRPHAVARCRGPARGARPGDGPPLPVRRDRRPGPRHGRRAAPRTRLVRPRRRPGMMHR